MELKLNEETNPNIIFNCGDKEMLVIKPDGFYIDGEKIEDNKHRIYERVLEFLGYHAINER